MTACIKQRNQLHSAEGPESINFYSAKGPKSIHFNQQRDLRKTTTPFSRRDLRKTSISNSAEGPEENIKFPSARDLRRYQFQSKEGPKIPSKIDTRRI
jgi:hypothetical protein